ncbi:hypothetical protein K440DRAFT_557560, partial [Wilcoxina mikolae CBS 423.85]
LHPLQITEKAMRKLLTFLRVTPDFLEYLFAYGEKSLPSDDGQGRATVTNSLDGAYAADTCYLLRYVEKNGRSWNSNPWSIRRTGVYHRYCPDTQSNVFIFLHPKEQTKLQERIHSLCTQDESSMPWANPMRLHLLLLSSYLDNWRWYLSDLGRDFLKTQNTALTIDIRDTDDYTLSFETMLALRNLESKVTPLSTVFGGTLPTIRSLQALNNMLHHEQGFNEKDHSQIANRLSIYESRLEGYIISTAALQDRIRILTDQLADALNLKNQETAASVNGHMLMLTRDTVDDSATVRVVTLVTLIYLPASFVATVLGMNLFNFSGTNNDGKGPRFTISKQFWIYIALSVPLTCFTVGYWFLMSHRHKMKRRQDSQLQQPRRSNEFQ